jgi:cob(I)alamin adenosyltransferase
VAQLCTRTGDDGTTRLPGGTATRKDDPRIEACGTLDELNAHLGLVRSLLNDQQSPSQIEVIQGLIFELGADVADRDSDSERLHDTDVLFLESAIDEATGRCEPLKTFTLPGGTAAAALLHVARTVCRRAERRLAPFAGEVPTGFRFLNRLSDLLFALARLDNSESGISESAWHPRH